MTFRSEPKEKIIGSKAINFKIKVDNFDALLRFENVCIVKIVMSQFGGKVDVSDPRHERQVNKIWWGPSKVRIKILLNSSYSAGKTDKQENSQCSKLYQDRRLRLWPNPMALLVRL